MRKAPTEWANRYGAGVFDMGDAIFERDCKNFIDTACPTRGLWFGKFMRLYKLRMIFIKKHDFGVTSEMAKALLVVWDIY